jgi:hypothetical protein
LTPSVVEHLIQSHADRQDLVMGRRLSARGFLHELGDPRLDRGGQLRHREGDRPHLAIVDPRIGLEPEGRVPHLELRGRLEAGWKKQTTLPSLA